MMLGGQIIRFGRSPWVDFLRIGNFSQQAEQQLAARLRAQLPDGQALDKLSGIEVAQQLATVDDGTIPELGDILDLHQRYLSDPQMSVAQAHAARLQLDRGSTGMTLGNALLSHYRPSVAQLRWRRQGARVSELVSALESLGGLIDDESLLLQLIIKASEITSRRGPLMYSDAYYMMSDYSYPEQLVWGAVYCFTYVEKSLSSENPFIESNQLVSAVNAISQRFKVQTTVDQSLNLSAYSGKDAEILREALHIRQDILKAVEETLRQEDVDPQNIETSALRMKSAQPEDYRDSMSAKQLAIQAHVKTLPTVKDAERRAYHVRRILSFLEIGESNVSSSWYPSFSELMDELEAEFVMQMETIDFCADEEQIRLQQEQFGRRPSGVSIVWVKHHDFGGLMKQLRAKGHHVVVYHRDHQLNDEQAQRVIGAYQQDIAEEYGIAFDEMPVEHIRSDIGGATALRAVPANELDLRSPAAFRSRVKHSQQTDQENRELANGPISGSQPKPAQEGNVIAFPFKAARTSEDAEDGDAED